MPQLEKDCARQNCPSSPLQTGDPVVTDDNGNWLGNSV